MEPMKKPEEDYEFVDFLRAQGIALGSLTAEELDALYEDYAGKRDLIATQRIQAEAMRNTAAPEGRMAGGIYAASNPLEHLGQLGSKFVGARASRDLNAQSEALNEKMATGQQAYGRALATAMAGGVPSPTPIIPQNTATPAAASGGVQVPQQATAPQPTQERRTAIGAAAPGVSPAPVSPTPMIFRPGPMQGGMTPANPEMPSYMRLAAEALRGGDSSMATEQSRLEDERRRKREEVRRKTGFLNDMYGGF